MFSQSSHGLYHVPVKSKSEEGITSAMKSILIQGRILKNLQVDQGSEFYNSNFKSLIRKYDVNINSTCSHLKSFIIKIFNQALKTWMFKKFSLRDNNKWIDILLDLIKNYNSKVHRTIGMKPKDVISANAYIREGIHTKLDYGDFDHCSCSPYKSCNLSYQILSK